MRPELVAALAAPLIAGIFGLVPLMVQIATTRAQRRDRMIRLNHLQAELEFLERMHALEGKLSAQGETTEPRTDLAIGDSLSKLSDQYDKLSELTPSAVAGGEQSPPQQHSLLRRAFLLYTPRTTSGWIIHTVFYMIAIVWIFVLLLAVAFAIDGFWEGLWAVIGFYGVPLGIALLIIRRRARQNAVRSATQPEEANT